MAEKFSGAIVDNAELGVPVVRLQYTDPDPARSITAEIAPEFGSNLYAYRVGEHNIIYCDPELLRDRDWTGTFVLWPIPNRVRNKEFEFEGHVQPLHDVKRKRGNEPLIHGFVDDQPWQHGEPLVSADSASVQTWIEITPDTQMFKYYPYASQLTLTYVLRASGITIEYEVENTGDRTMPFGFALHPYFATLSGSDKTLVTLPAEHVMETDDDLLPLGSLAQMDQQDYDLRRPTPVGDLTLDHVFTGLHETVAPTITYPDQGLTLTLAASPDFTHMVLYTLESDKGFICYENQTGSTDMINLHTKAHKSNDPDLAKAAHLLVLPAGQKHRGYITYAVSFEQ
jgi:aldose 1-epimerase